MWFVLGQKIENISVERINLRNCQLLIENISLNNIIIIIHRYKNESFHIDKEYSICNSRSYV